MGTLMIPWLDSMSNGKSYIENAKYIFKFKFEKDK